MIENLKIKGKWWLPGKISKIPGTFSFSPQEGLFLELQGSFKEKGRYGFSIPIILGFSETGEQITLYKCYEKSLSTHFPETPKSVFLVEYGFIGAHFVKSQEIKFKKVSVKYHYLNEWFNKSGFSICPSCSESTDRFQVKYKLPERVEIKLKNGFKISIDTKVSPPPHQYFVALEKEVHIKEENFLTIEPPTELSFEEFLKWIHIFQELLFVLIFDICIYPVEIYGYTTRNRDPNEEIKIIYQFLPSGITRSGKHVLIPLIPYSFVEEKIEFIFNNWVEKFEKLSFVSELYFYYVCNRKHLSIDLQFLTLVTALEAYHRKMIRSKDLSDEEYKKRLEAILENVPSEYKDWLRKKLEYANEPSLRKRIKEILDTLGDINCIIQLVPTKDKKKKFIHDIVKNRNSLIHPIPGSENKVSEWSELFWIVQKLNIIVEICLLRELGLTNSEINEIFTDQEINYITATLAREI